MSARPAPDKDIGITLSEAAIRKIMALNHRLHLQSATFKQSPSDNRLRNGNAVEIRGMAESSAYEHSLMAIRSSLVCPFTTVVRQLMIWSALYETQYGLRPD